MCIRDSSSSYTNIYGKQLQSWDFVGASGLHYPGAGGLVYSDNGWPGCWFGTAEPSQVHGATGCLLRGTWFAELPKSVTFEANYDREIAWLSRNRGLEINNALTQLSCNVINTNLKAQAFVTYSIEAENSGYLSPADPIVTLSTYPMKSPQIVYFPLVLGFYILCEEIQDMMIFGWRQWLLHEGWLNLMDLLAVGTLLLVYVFELLYYGVLPELDMQNLRGDTWWTLASVQSSWQTLLGLACFAMVFKGLKFTHNVPVMSLSLIHISEPTRPY
eukprot:TRINITY_DN29035_c0_g1_i1.p1 TRINITY_DN29035_c0_g1~~TRINITY_DN29035_c0_g1_i1.p1  ORF type:complete len:273 (+),score=64.43 TRINITY_DN29035_c0_g1_i1:157-975(+)